MAFAEVWEASIANTLAGLPLSQQFQMDRLSAAPGLFNQGVPIPIPSTKSFQVFYSSQFTVSKPKGGPCLNLNVKAFNTFMHSQKIWMESIQLFSPFTPEAFWHPRSDIKDAYIHIPFFPCPSNLFTLGWKTVCSLTLKCSQRFLHQFRAFFVSSNIQIILLLCKQTSLTLNSYVINHAVDFGPLWMNPEHKEVIFAFINIPFLDTSCSDPMRSCQNCKARFGNFNPTEGIHVLRSSIHSVLRQNLTSSQHGQVQSIS